MPSVDRVREAQRHERLRNLMTEKVLSHVGRSVSDSEKDYVIQEVDVLLHRGENSEKALRAIAQHLRRLTPAASVVGSSAPTAESIRRLNDETATREKKARRAGRSSAPPSNVPTSIVSAARAADAAVARLSNEQATRCQTVRELPPGVTPELMAAVSAEQERANHRRVERPQERHADDLWAKLAQKEVEEYHKDALQERRRLKRMEDEQRLFLEQQVALRNRKAEERKVEERKFYSEEERQRKLWADEEKRKAEERKRRFAEEKQSRDQQLEESRQRRAIDEAKRRAEEAEAAARDRDVYDREQAQMKQKRAEAKLEVLKAQEYNRHFEVQKMANRRKEKERDLEHQRQFLERLKKQEEDHEEALVRMHEKQRHQQQIAFKMQASFTEKAEEDLKRAQEIEKERDNAAAQQEKRRQEDQQNAKVRQRQYLMLQMLEHDEARKREREAQQREREEAQAAKEKADREEVERIIAKKKKTEAQRQAIEQQIHQSQGRNRPVYMNAEEMKLNVPLLRKAGIAS